MGFTSDEMRQFVDAVRGEPEGGECVVRGTVTRVDADGTAWVQIGQNAEPTPCGMDVSARVGDIVTVRIANHRATVTGNSTSPATDDRTAIEAHGVATAAKASADVAQEAATGAQEAAASAATTARAAETAAGEAKQAVSTVNQHFWNDTHGAHVTEAEMDDYLEEPSGFQNLMTSLGNIFTKAVNGVERILRSDTASGMVMYDGECAPDAQDLEDHVIAAFAKDEVVLGRSAAGKTQVKVYNDTTYGDAGFLVTNTDDQGVTSGTYIERGRLSVGGPNYDESNHEEFVATHQQISLTEGWQAPEVGMGNRNRGGAMFYGFDTNFNPTVRYSVDWNGNISTTGNVSDGTGSLDQVRQDSKNAANITSGTLPIARGGTGATTASAAVQALTGRTWDFGTNNTSDTWVPVATAVSGEARWQHRSIPTNVATTPTSLWSGDSNGNLTLSQSAANFTRITIYYRDNDNQYSSVDVYSPNGKTVLMFSSWEGHTNKIRTVKFNGTSLTTVKTNQWDSVHGSPTTPNYIYIIRVLGWKY